MMNGTKGQGDVVMSTSKEWWVMYIYDCCSIAARRFAEMCTRGVHCGNNADGLMLACNNGCIDGMVVCPLGGVAGVINGLGVYIVADICTKGVYCDGFGLDRDDVYIAVDWNFLDGGALEAPESHLRVVRTPAHLLGMNREIYGRSMVLTGEYIY